MPRNRINEVEKQYYYTIILGQEWILQHNQLKLG